MISRRQMTTSDASRTADTSLARGWWHGARQPPRTQALSFLLTYFLALGPYLGNRWVMIAIGAFVVVIGAYLGWGWVVAAGIAPIILALAPCLIMCGLGLCSMKMLGSGGPK
jgi:hypothetical protein